MRALPVLAAATLCLAVLSGCAGTNDHSSSSAPTTQAPGAADARLESHVVLATNLGNITIALYDQLVPLTAQNFATLVASHAYDGTRFSRIVKGYDIQGGDLTTAGRAAAAYKLPDEFHTQLRHDRAGLVSMATPGPDAGNTQFFITTAPVPSYDDRYSIFGHVIAGMDVVDAIAALPINGTAYGPPLSPVTITSSKLVPAAALATDASVARHGVAVASPTVTKVAVAGGNVTFAVVVTNTGNVRDTFTLNATAPSGGSVSWVNPRVALPAGRTWLMVLRVTAGSSSGDVQVTAHSETDASKTASLTLHLAVGDYGPLPRLGQTVTADYTGLLEDGRTFDTSRSDVAQNPALPKMSSYFQRQAFQPYVFTLGAGDVAGFVAQVQLTHVGETSVSRVPWNLGYTDNALNNQVLYKRTVYFEVNVQSAASTGPATVCDSAPRSSLTLSDAHHSVVAVSTSVGCMAFELYDDKAPVTVQNFLTYVRDGFYTGTSFYRLVSGLVDQAGGGTSKAATHPAIKDEAVASGLHNDAYTVAMARTSDPNSATSEFFINVANNTAGHAWNLDPNTQDPNGYAVFGNVVAGRDVADRINGMASNPPSILSITVL